MAKLVFFLVPTVLHSKPGATMGGMLAGVDEYYHQRTLSVFERMKNQVPGMRLRLLEVVGIVSLK